MSTGKLAIVDGSYYLDGKWISGEHADRIIAERRELVTRKDPVVSDLGRIERLAFDKLRDSWLTADGPALQCAVELVEFLRPHLYREIADRFQAEVPAKWVIQLLNEWAAEMEMS